MGFDLATLIDAHRGEGHTLHARHLNPQVPRVLHAIGFDKVYVRADGPYLYDADGNRYLDFLAGFGVSGVGRNHPVVRKALQEVLDSGLADMVQFDCALLPGLLAEQLLAKAPGLDRVYFCNSGAEAVEAALKFARCATRRRRILYCDHAYHGLTVGALSINGGAEFRSGFDPLLPDTVIPFGDLDALELELKRGDVAAFIIEPIQGKGINVAPPGFLAAARRMLDEHGSLLICDEVMTGIGRTGSFFAYQHEDVQPDIVTVAKALSGGFVPVGATLARAQVFEKVYSSLDRVFVHASTFAANALAMAAGLATLAIVEDEGLVAAADYMGSLLQKELQARIDRYELLADVRGRGLALGIEFGKPQSLKLRGGWASLQAARKGLFAQIVVVSLFQRHRILTQVAADRMDVIRLLPPLIISESEVQAFLDAFDAVMEEAQRGSGLMWDFGRTLVKQALTR
jgi:acetylornithine/succinyldiaminopimelate/putrescine aminotransferase